MKSAVYDVMSKALGAIPFEDGDYYNDLLYCGKCNTPKEKDMEFPWGKMRVRCMCKCQSEKYAEEQRKEREKQRRIQAEQIRSLFPDKAMISWNFSNDDRKNPVLSDACKKYVQNFSDLLKAGKGLLFFGPVGTGKTYYATCIANALIDNGFRVYVTNFPRLCNKLFHLQDKQDAIDDLNTYDLLVIDDLASERKTEYMDELVWNVIDTRYRAKLPIIITTNLTSEELKNTEISQARIFSRLYEMCTFIPVDGKDRRANTMKQSYNEMKTLLGLGG